MWLFARFSGKTRVQIETVPFCNFLVKWTSLIKEKIKKKHITHKYNALKRIILETLCTRRFENYSSYN